MHVRALLCESTAVREPPLPCTIGAPKGDEEKSGGSGREPQRIAHRRSQAWVRGQVLTQGARTACLAAPAAPALLAPATVSSASNKIKGRAPPPVGSHVASWGRHSGPHTLAHLDRARESTGTGKRGGGRGMGGEWVHALRQRGGRGGGFVRRRAHPTLQGGGRNARFHDVFLVAMASSCGRVQVGAQTLWGGQMPPSAAHPPIKRARERCLARSAAPQPCSCTRALPCGAAGPEGVGAGTHACTGAKAGDVVERNAMPPKARLVPRTATCWRVGHQACVRPSPTVCNSRAEPVLRGVLQRQEGRAREAVLLLGGGAGEASHAGRVRDREACWRANRKKRATKQRTCTAAAAAAARARAAQTKPPANQTTHRQHHHPLTVCFSDPAQRRQKCRALCSVNAPPPPPLRRPVPTQQTPRPLKRLVPRPRRPNPVTAGGPGAAPHMIMHPTPATP